MSSVTRDFRPKIKTVRGAALISRSNLVCQILMVCGRFRGPYTHEKKKIEAARFAKNESQSTCINQEFYEEREIAFARALAAELRSSGYLEGKIRERIIALSLDLTDLSSVKRFEKGAKKALLDYVRRERDSVSEARTPPRSEDGAALRRGLNLKSEQEEVQRRFHALICNAAVWAGPEGENLPFSVNCVGHHHLINKLSKGDDGHGYSLFGGSLKASHFSVSRLLAQQHQQKQNPERNTAGRVAAAPAVKNKPRIVFVTSGLLQFGTLPDELQQRLGRGQLQGDSVEREEGHRGDEPEEPATSRARQARHEYADSKLVNALQHLAYASVFGHVVDTAAVCPGWCATRLGRPSTAAAGRTDCPEGTKAGDQQVQEKTAVVPSIVQPASCPFASLSPRKKPAVAGGGESTSSTSWQMITGFLIPAMLKMRLPRSAEEGGAEVVEATVARLETTSISGANSDPLVRSGFFAAGASSESGRPDAIQRRCEVEVAKYVHSDYLRPTFFARFLRGLDQIVEARKQ
mmetsp:Transcript_1532/g.3611  ORF Transcript_1532/g.3611 Transcript_1532/m.3611 type:complete len:520 (+) Transcript_1532:3059-4618(+)